MVPTMRSVTRVGTEKRIGAGCDSIESLYGDNNSAF
jgi:hypothetical protein